MSQSAENQPVLSRSAKILIIGLAQFFIMGMFGAAMADSIMDSSELASLNTMTFLSSHMDLVIYILIGSVFFISGSITLIVSGILYIIDKKKGIRFAVPKNQPTSIKRQTIYAIIPLLDMYAAFKVKKFWFYFLIMIGVSILIIPLDELEIFPQTVLESWLVNEAIVLPISVVIIRIFSKKWNQQFSENQINDEIK